MDCPAFWIAAIQPEHKDTNPAAADDKKSASTIGE
jgi:hypothetical protein